MFISSILAQNTQHLSPLEDLLETIGYQGMEWWSPFLSWLEEEFSNKYNERTVTAAFNDFGWSRRRWEVWNAFHQAEEVRRELFSWVLAYNVGPAQKVEDLAAERKCYVNKIIEFTQQALGHYQNIVGAVEEASQFLNEVLQIPVSTKQQAFELRLQEEVRKPVSELEKMLQLCQELYEDMGHQ